MSSKRWKRLESTFAKTGVASGSFQPNRIALLIVFFACSFLLRVLGLERDVFGDEAYYYYLSRFPEQYLTLHLDHPPLLYLSYFPFTANITTFRAVNAVVGSLIPCLVYLILSTYNVAERYRVLGGSLPVFFMVFVRYSTVVFLDTLCTFFFLVGVYFYRRERWRLTDLFFGLSILTKEVAILGVAVFIGCLLVQRRPIRFFPIVALSTSVVFIVLIPFGGWVSLWYGAAHGVFEDFFLFSITPALLPLIAVLLYRRYYVESLFFIAYPLLFFLYQATSDWYFVFPLSFNIVSIMVALNEVHGLHFKKTYVKYVLLIFFASSIAFSSCSQALATSTFISYRPHQLQDVTQFLIKDHKERRMVAIDCFWGNSLYPFGTYMKVANSTYTSYNLTVRYYSSLINETGLAVIGTCGEGSANRSVRGSLLRLYGDNVVFSNSNYTVIDLKRSRALNVSQGP